LAILLHPPISIFLLLFGLLAARLQPEIARFDHEGSGSSVDFNGVAPLFNVEAQHRAWAPVELGLSDEAVDDHVFAKQRVQQI
jgi:hypothetical protein